MKKQIKQGFTVVELLIVFAIIVLLSTIILINIINQREKARVTGVLQSAASIYHNLGAYIIGEWKFEDNSDDSSGNENHGTPTDIGYDLNPVSSELGKTADFNGASSKVDTGPDFIETSALTICAWIYPEGWGESNSGRIIDNGKVIFALTAGSKLSFSSDGGSTTITSGADIILNKWRFVCVARNSAGNEVNFYVDAILSGSANQDSGIPVLGTTNVIIGNNNIQNSTFNGKIDEVRIYKETLILDQIKKNYIEGAFKRRIAIND